MKAIYTKLNDKIYRINMNNKRTPVNCLSMLEPQMDKEYLEYCGKVRLRYHLSTLKMDKTNQEKFNELIDFLTTKKVTQIDTVEDFFSIAIDYSILDEMQREVLHNISIIPVLTNNDCVAPFGVTNSNECMYRQVKELFAKNEVHLDVRNPIGLMHDIKDCTYFKINDISVFQDLYKMDTVHPSVKNVPYIYGSQTVVDTLKTKLPVFSTRGNNMDIPPVKFETVPRVLELDLGILLSDYTVVYDDETVNKVLIKNINERDQEDNPSGDIIGVGGIPERYERCEEETPNALKVVEDLYPDETFDKTTMVRKSDVIGDIPDIALGDFVVLKTADVDETDGIKVNIVG